VRKIVSIILSIAFIILSITGIQISMEGGHKNHDIGNNVLSNVSDIPHQPSFYPKEAHEWFGYIFIIVGIAHLILNIKPLLSYFRIKSKINTYSAKRN
jgi:cytochrome b561